LNDASPAQGPCNPTSYHESSKQQAEPALTFYLINVEPSGVQALKNPNPLKDVEALAVLGVAVLV